MLSACALRYSRAIMADSFITSPKFPVKVSFPLPLVILDSIKSTSPPILVHANPVTTPRDLWSIFLILDRPAPRTSNKSLAIMLLSKDSSIAICLVLLRTSFAITLSNPLTPDSLVYSSIICLRTGLLNLIWSFAIPCSFICLGNKCRLAISTFSSIV